MRNWILFTFFLGMFSSVFGQNNWKKLSEELIVTDSFFAQCHASALVEIAPDKLAVAFFAGSHESANDVKIWMALHTDGRWQKPHIVAKGGTDTGPLPCWNPVLFKTATHKLMLFYKVGPNPREWWGMVKSSVDDGKTWEAEHRLPAEILGPIKNKPVQLQNGTILSPSSVETVNSWKVHVEKSTDDGKSWQNIYVDTISAFKVIQPSLLVYPNHKLQLLCRSDQDHIVQSWSADDGNTWSKFSLLDLPNPNSGIDAVTLKNGWQLLVYNPTMHGKEWFNSRGKLVAAVSKNGKDWQQIMMLEDGIEGNEFSYPAVIQTADGKVHITYTYNRKNIKHVVLQQ